MIPGIQSGIDFEQYIRNCFGQIGILAQDTPVTNDYGADLVFEYKGILFVVQCKYYTSAIGISAVQQILGAIPMYNAQYGIVITNSSFSPQAVSLASNTGILLVSGSDLSHFFIVRPQGVPALDALLAGQPMAIRNNSTAFEEWTITDLMIRYGVSRDIILQCFMNSGLPYYKTGQEYRFNPQMVKDWEIQRGFIFIRNMGIMELPAFRIFKSETYDDLQLAKLQHNKEKIKEYKQKLKNAKRMTQMAIAAAKSMRF